MEGLTILIAIAFGCLGMLTTAAVLAMRTLLEIRTELRLHNNLEEMRYLQSIYQQKAEKM